MSKYESRIRLIVEKHINNIKNAEADCDLRQYGLNSLTFVKIVIEIEDYFEIEFPYDSMSVEEVCTINDLCNIVNEIKG